MSCLLLICLEASIYCVYYGYTKLWKHEVSCKRNKRSSRLKKMFSGVMITCVLLFCFTVKVLLEEIYKNGILYGFQCFAISLLFPLLLFFYEYNNMLGTARRRRWFYEKEKRKFKLWKTYQLKRELSIYDVDNSFLSVLKTIVKLVVKICALSVSVVLAALGLGYGEVQSVAIEVICAGDESYKYGVILLAECVLIFLCAYIINFTTLGIRKSVIKDICEERKNM